MQTISFEAQLLDKGGASEIKCRKISLITQELDDFTLGSIPLMDKQIVKITVEYI